MVPSHCVMVGYCAPMFDDGVGSAVMGWWGGGTAGERDQGVPDGGAAGELPGASTVDAVVPGADRVNPTWVVVTETYQAYVASRAVR